MAPMMSLPGRPCNQKRGRTPPFGSYRGAARIAACDTWRVHIERRVELPFRGTETALRSVAGAGDIDHGVGHNRGAGSAAERAGKRAVDLNTVVGADRIGIDVRQRAEVRRTG